MAADPSGDRVRRWRLTFVARASAVARLCEALLLHSMRFCPGFITSAVRLLLFLLLRKLLMFQRAGHVDVYVLHGQRAVDEARQAQAEPAAVGAHELRAALQGQPVHKRACGSFSERGRGKGAGAAQELTVDFSDDVAGMHGVGGCDGAACCDAEHARTAVLVQGDGDAWRR